MLGGWPPPPPLSGVLSHSPPPLPARRAPGSHAAREVPSGSWWFGSWVPPVRACRALVAHAAQGTPLPRLPPSESGLAPLPVLACHVLRAHAALQGGLPLPLGSGRAPPAPVVHSLDLLPPADVGGYPLPGLACLALGAQAAVPGGPPLLPGSDRAPWARAVCPPSPPARARFARAAGAGGPRPGDGPRLPGGFRWVMLGGSPPCRCCTPLARAAGRGVHLPLPPLYGRSC